MKIKYLYIIGKKINNLCETCIETLNIVKLQETTLKSTYLTQKNWSYLGSSVCLIHILESSATLNNTAFRIISVPLLWNKWLIFYFE